MTHRYTGEMGTKKTGPPDRTALLTQRARLLVQQLINRIKAPPFNGVGQQYGNWKGPGGEIVHAMVNMVGLKPIIRAWVESPADMNPIQPLPLPLPSLVYAVYRPAQGDQPNKIVVYRVAVKREAAADLVGRAPYVMTWSSGGLEWAIDKTGAVTETVFTPNGRISGAFFKVVQDPITKQDVAISWSKPGKIFIGGKVAHYITSSDVIVCATLDFSYRVAPETATEVGWFVPPGDTHVSGEPRLYKVDFSEPAEKMLYFQFPTALVGEYYGLPDDMINGRTFVCRLDGRDKTTNELNMLETGVYGANPEIVAEYVASSETYTASPPGATLDDEHILTSQSASRTRSYNTTLIYKYVVAFNARFIETALKVDVLTLDYDSTNSGGDFVSYAGLVDMEAWTLDPRPCAAYNNETRHNTDMYTETVSYDPAIAGTVLKLTIFGKEIVIYSDRSTWTGVSSTAIKRGSIDVRICVTGDEYYIDGTVVGEISGVIDTSGRVFSHVADIKYITGGLSQHPAIFQTGRWYGVDTDAAGRDWDRGVVVWTPTDSFRIEDLLPEGIGPQDPGAWPEFFEKTLPITIGGLTWIGEITTPGLSEVEQLRSAVWRHIINGCLTSIFNLGGTTDTLLGDSAWQQRVTPPAYYSKFNGQRFLLVPLRPYLCASYVDTGAGWVRNDSNIEWSEWQALLYGSNDQFSLTTETDFRFSPVNDNVSYRSAAALLAYP
jgi:hypothetical protein